MAAPKEILGKDYIIEFCINTPTVPTVHVLITKDIFTVHQ